MNYEAFERAVHEVFEGIPEEFREGVDGLEVSRATVPHPTLPDIYTLGECKTESYPSEFGGAGEVRSIVAIYYGSFLELSRLDEEWDWEEEIFTTVTHEVQHHLESLATEESLEELDYAEDQNFARREGERFDPFFYRSGTAVGEGAWEVDADLFLEVGVGRRDVAAGSVPVSWAGRSHRLPVEASGADVQFVRIGDREDAPGELFAVVLRRRGVRGWIGALFGWSPLEVVQTDAAPEPPS